LEELILNSKNELEIGDVFRDAIFKFDEKSIVRLCLIYILKFGTLGKCSGGQAAIRQSDLESLGVEEEYISLIFSIFQSIKGRKDEQS
jgi:hypothetical protein